MASSPRTMVVLVAAVVLLVAATTRVAEAQSSTIPSCAQKLTSCANYLNATDPPKSCCDPLKEAVTKEMPCLCNLFNTPGLLSAFGVNMKDALSLAARCKIAGDVNSCVKAASPNSTPAAPSTTKPPPASPGAGSSNSGGAVKIAGTGISAGLLFSTCVMMLQ